MRSRLSSICPYFAMFPEAFAEEQIGKFTSPGDYVLDPFCGRGTTLLQALLMGRHAAAADINPVAYCITAAKANVPSLNTLLEEICRLEREYLAHGPDEVEEERLALPPFFARAFHQATLRQILFLRRALNWRSNSTHTFIAALVLGSLHGEMTKSRAYFSNQMPRTISTKPAYSLRYWEKHDLWPPERDVFQILRYRAEFRLNSQVPRLRGDVALTDARLCAQAFQALRGCVKAVVTSPPYLNVTRFEEDQWLRLWFLGNPPHPTYGGISTDDRHAGETRYWRFLSEAWAGIAPLLRPDAVLVCRIGAKDIQPAQLTSRVVESVRRVFPTAQLATPPTVSQLQRRQTNAFRPGATGCLFEVDLVFTLK